ncbi:ATP-binding protein [Aerolutibacter ruishenii]|uniref:Serine/threonine-protein kinase RsbW n=1 Tax=Aerolutibacter ruishenii TaxID=686800 RepID=A0A562LI88_9GAMM|nr:ATP-binding protein [Lysobacter ruishenii]TWI07317.1 serine/threonine-protein kinase RsbW [Lysobacter ruishenii]
MSAADVADATDLSAPQRLHLTCPAELPQLPALLALADRACAAAGADAAATYAVRLAVEEVVANIIAHGYGTTRQGPVALTLDWNVDRVRIDIRDHAPRFDPEAVPAPDMDAPWESRNPGGIGWALVTRLMTTIHHRYDPATGNRFTFTRDLAP